MRKIILMMFVLKYNERNENLTMGKERQYFSLSLYVVSPL